MDNPFKTYDIRGDLSTDFAFDLGSCVAGKYGDLVVMSDSKKSSIELLNAFSEGVKRAGFNVINCGVGPTDMCSVAGLHFKRVSVMFTASHLSDSHDGIKFHDNKGLPFSTEMINGLKNLKSRKSLIKGSISKVDFLNEYTARALRRYRELFNHDLLGLKVLVDLKNGCGVTPLLLKRLGAVVDVINTNGANPGNGSLAELVKRASNYDLVLVHDFDADRVVIVNKDGIIHGSLVACMISSIFKGSIVASVDSSEVISKFSKIFYSKVGDPFVARAIIKNKAVLGVEPSGHYTDPCFAPTSSGSLFALIIAGLACKKSINERLKELPSIVFDNTSISVDDKNDFMKKAINRINNIISDIDGLKFFFNGGTALVRPSGTEPIIRLQLENASCSVNELVEFLK